LVARKINIAVLFGGRSSEHEISILTALQFISAVDTKKYEITPVYISSKGKWYTHSEMFSSAFFKALPGSLKKAEELLFLPHPGTKGLLKVSSRTEKDSSYSIEQNGFIPIDVYVPALHGTHGEDGAIQGLFELANVMYTGSDLRSSAITMNKWAAKVIASSNNIPVLPGIVVHKKDFHQHFDTIVPEILKEDVQFPLIIKPCNLGSSVGLNFANNEVELLQALTAVFKLDAEALVEKRVTNIREINVAVHNSADPIASVIEVPLNASELLTYEKKYMSESGKTGKSALGGMASLKRKIDPPEITPERKKEARELACKIYSKLGCGGAVRIDFIVDMDTDIFYFNELNSLPGSFSYYLWADSHPPLLMTEIADRIIQEAITRFGEKSTLKRILPFRALR